MASVGILRLGGTRTLATSILQANLSWDVSSLDVSFDQSPQNQLFSELNRDQIGTIARKSSFLLLISDETCHIDDIFFHEESELLSSLHQQSIILISVNSQPGYYESLQSRLADQGSPHALLVDFHLVQGGKSAEEANLSSVWASGAPNAITAAGELLNGLAEKVDVISGGLGSASKLKLVSQMLYGVHLVTAAEATGLAERAGIDGEEAWRIIKTAAGGSTAYESEVPNMLNKDWRNDSSSLDGLLEDLSSTVSAARSLQFPLPLASAAEQTCLSGISRGYGSQGPSGLVRLFLQRQAPDGTSTPAESDDSKRLPDGEDDTAQPLTPPAEISNVGFVGLGAMGQGMARSLVRRGFTVQGYDTYPPSIDKFASFDFGNDAVVGNALPANSPAAAAKDSAVFVIVVQNAAQVADVLFGAGKAAEALPHGATIILMSTVPPSFSRDLELRLDALGRGLKLVDAPVSGGVVRAANGDLTIICSGQYSGLHAAHTPLMAMAGKETNIYRVKGGAGAASSVKLVNQLLAGVHITASAEAMALAARLGLDTQQVFALFRASRPWSWMLENRVPQMLAADWTPHSALAIFVKDLGIVLEEGRRLRAATPISSVAHALYLDGAARGWAKEADAGIVRFWGGESGGVRRVDCDKGNE